MGQSGMGVAEVAELADVVFTHGGPVLNVEEGVVVVLKDDGLDIRDVKTVDVFVEDDVDRRIDLADEVEELSVSRDTGVEDAAEEIPVPVPEFEEKVSVVTEVEELCDIVITADELQDTAEVMVDVRVNVSVMTNT